MRGHGLVPWGVVPHPSSSSALQDCYRWPWLLSFFLSTNVRSELCVVVMWVDPKVGFCSSGDFLACLCWARGFWGVYLLLQTTQQSKHTEICQIFSGRTWQESPHVQCRHQVCWSMCLGTVIQNTIHIWIMNICIRFFVVDCSDSSPYTTISFEKPFMGSHSDSWLRYFRQSYPFTRGRTRRGTFSSA